MRNPNNGKKNLEATEVLASPKTKLKLGKSLLKKGFTKYRSAKASKTFQCRHRSLRNRGSNLWTIPLVPFWAIGYCLWRAISRIREVKRNFSLKDFRNAGIFLFLWTARSIQKLCALLVSWVLTGLCGVPFVLWTLLKGLWWIIKAFCLFVFFLVSGIPGFLRDCRYFVRKCTFPGWRGMKFPSDKAISDGVELKRPLGIIGQGFLLIGGLSYIIKIVHLPLNEILVCPDLHNCAHL
jgi:hypothetical protein